MENCQDKAEVQNKCIGVNESTSEQEAPVGVLTHYRNDGSYSYLLTPLVSPPPSENVKRWLSAGNRSHSYKFQILVISFWNLSDF